MEAERAGDRAVVITHHAPSPRSIRDWYKGDPFNCAFASDLGRVIERYQPALWIHGHMHDPVDKPAWEDPARGEPGGIRVRGEEGIRPRVLPRSRRNAALRHIDWLPCHQGEQTWFTASEVPRQWSHDAETDIRSRSFAGFFSSALSPSLEPRPPRLGAGSSRRVLRAPEYGFQTRTGAGSLRGWSR